VLLAAIGLPPQSRSAIDTSIRLPARLPHRWQRSRASMSIGRACAGWPAVSCQSRSQA
jgi:hypothetical protein